MSIWRKQYFGRSWMTRSFGQTLRDTLAATLFVFAPSCKGPNGIWSSSLFFLHKSLTLQVRVGMQYK